MQIGGSPTQSRLLQSIIHHLNGYSQALEEDYSERVDETAKSYLSRIRAASQRMTQLIDDLLALSNPTHSDHVEKFASERSKGPVRLTYID